MSYEYGYQTVVEPIVPVTATYETILPIAEPRYTTYYPQTTTILREYIRPAREIVVIEKPIIAVLGATGSQGGGLVKAILEDFASPFAVRAITRDVNSEKAKALAKMGAEVVAANLDDRASLLQALRGVYGAFFVTFFWEHKSTAKETAHAKLLAEVAKAAGVEHVIWSTLEDTRLFMDLADPRMPTLEGKFKVPHFDTKGEADKYFRELGVPTTFLLASFYWDNLISFGMGPKKGADGKLTFSLPTGDKKMPGIAADDIGRVAYGIFLRGKQMIGKTVGAAGEHLSGAQMAELLSLVLGTEISYTAIPPNDYRALGFPAAVEMGNMFQFYADFDVEYRLARPVQASQELHPKLLTFVQWLARNKDKIPLE